MRKVDLLEEVEAQKCYVIMQKCLKLIIPNYNSYEDLGREKI